MYTWGWVFGGEFYDPASGKVTADHPNNIAALTWMVESFAKKYDPTRLSGFQSSFGSGATSPLYQGQIAMQPVGNWELTNIATYKPDLEYGLAPLPVGPNNASPDSAWIGGWCAGIPKGAKNPEAAFQFLNFLTGNGGGVDQWANITGFFPGYRHATYFTEVAAQDPNLAIFLQILENAKHQRPAIPVQAFYFRALGSAVDDAIFGDKSPEDALKEATETTQRELDRVLRRRG